eukprot:2870850-Alexandrium_andersonii.AAC.1
MRWTVKKRRARTMEASVLEGPGDADASEADWGDTWPAQGTRPRCAAGRARGSPSGEEGQAIPSGGGGARSGQA